MPAEPTDGQTPADPAAGLAGPGGARRGHVPDHQVADVPAVHAAQPGADAEQLADRAQAGQAVLPAAARRLQARTWPRRKKKITEAARWERRMRRHDAPDPAAVLVTALGPRRRLWERRRWDSDRLLLRVGTARLRSAIELTGGSPKDTPEPPMLEDVPVTVPLIEAGGVLGVAGPAREVHAHRALAGRPGRGAAQPARPVDRRAHRRRRPGRLGVDPLAAAHPAGQPARRVSLTGSSAATTARRVSELAGMVQQRQAQLEASGRGFSLARMPVRAGRARRRAAAALAARHADRAAGRPGGRRVRDLPGRRGAAAARGVPGGRRLRAGRAGHG